MPSSPTTRNRFVKQAAGEGLNVWGILLNTGVFDLVDTALDGWTTKALTGDYTLTSANYVADESRARVLKFTGAGPFTVTIPSVEKAYFVWNACTAVLTVTTGAGDAVTMAAGEIAPVICDASNVKKVKVIDYGTDTVSGGTPTASAHFTTKGYVDGLAFAATNLPGQSVSTVNQYVRSNGSVASWATPSVSEITGAAPLAAPSFTGGITVVGGAVINGGLTFVGATGITGDLTVTGTLTVGELAATSDVVPFPKWKAGAASGSVTELVIPLDDSFECWEIHLRNITMAGDGYMLAALSFDNGGTYKTAADDYAWQSVLQNGAGLNGDTRANATHMHLTDATEASFTTEAGDAFLRITSKAGRETRCWAEFGFDNATSGAACMGALFSVTNLKGYGKASHIRLGHSLGSNFTLDYSIYGVR